MLDNLICISFADGKVPVCMNQIVNSSRMYHCIVAGGLACCDKMHFREDHEIDVGIRDTAFAGMVFLLMGRHRVKHEQ